MMHCLLQKSQHLRLLFIEQYMNSNRVLPKCVKKKKKKKEEQKRKTQTGSKRRRVSKLNHQLVRLATGFDIGILFDKLDDNHQNLTW